MNFHILVDVARVFGCLFNPRRLSQLSLLQHVIRNIFIGDERYAARRDDSREVGLKSFVEAKPTFESKNEFCSVARMKGERKENETINKIIYHFFYANRFASFFS